MKIILSMALILISLGANAETIKPQNAEDAFGVVSVDGVNFNYRVTDRGWQTSANFENGNAKIKAIKSFVLNYSGPSSAQGSRIEAALYQDGLAKCQELGEIEYKEQTKTIPDYSSSLKAEIVNALVESASDAIPAMAVFVCLVTVEAKN